jgi:hypothetical protein
LLKTWGIGPVRVLVLIWLGWSALMLAYPVFVRARFDLARPDVALEWTADNTRVDPHKDEDGAWRRVLGPHVQWDSVYYLSIAAHGYDDPDGQALGPGSTEDAPHLATKGEQPTWIPLNYAYFPLYPLAIRLAAWPLELAGVAPPTAGVLAGVAVSLAGALGAMLALFNLGGAIAGDSANGDDDGLRAAFYVLVWPASFFMAQVYTEGLFLGASFGALALMWRGRWGWAALLAVAAAWTRSTGALLLLPFVWRWVADGGPQALLRQPDLRALARLAAVVSPALAYLAWQAVFGARFTFVEANYFGRGLLWLSPSWHALAASVHAAFGARGAQASAYALMDLAGLALGVTSSLWLCRRSPPLGLYGLALIAVAMTSGTDLGIYRYVLGVPALFLAPAQLGRHVAFDRLWTLAGGLALSVALIAFSSGFWAG